MKKFYLSILALSMAGLSFVSCSSDDDDDDAKKSEPAQQYVSTAMVACLESQQKYVDIKATVTKTDGTDTVISVNSLKPVDSSDLDSTISVDSYDLLIGADTLSEEEIKEKYADLKFYKVYEETGENVKLDIKIQLEKTNECDGKEFDIVYGYGVNLLSSAAFGGVMCDSLDAFIERINSGLK